MTSNKAKRSTNKAITPKQDNVKKNNTVNFPIVGIGASAGGYEACTQLLGNLPADMGLTFIIVQHLHPAHDSALSDLLNRSTTLPVTEIKDGILVEPNHVYVIPPNTELDIFHKKLQLSPRSDTVPHLPIDHFLRSLADDQGSKAIGVILSGSASDGVMGLQAIKAQGGITFCQDEDSAKYNSMPHSAIVAGCVDFILPPEKIAQELLYIARHPFIQLERTENIKLNKKGLVTNKEDLNKLFLLLRKVTGIDFTYYKMTTLQRRISRRMILHKIETLKEYIDYLQAHTKEIDALYQDILINVTDFFRDSQAFETLEKEIFPLILRSDMRQEPVRIWIPGCSTGEEAYSIAMTLLEYLDRDASISIQIFATDIDDKAIEIARQGLYRASIAEKVSKQRLQRFFNQLDNGYQIKKNIRDLCVFAKQNVFKDPPFSKIDLISCRNLLIYLGPVLQKRILSIFHYALVPNGILFLGSAETVGEHIQLFKMIDQKHKFYSKKSLATPLHLDFTPPNSVIHAEAKTETRLLKKYDAWSSVDLQQIADRMIMQKYAPAAVVINEHMQILQFRGQTGRFLEPTPGEASLNLMKMVREGLLVYLRSLLQRSMSEHVFVRKENLKYNYDDKIKYVDIEITPIQHPNQAEHCYLIVFEEPASNSTNKETLNRKKTNKDNIDEKKYSALTQELAATKEYLQSVIEQQEVSNEELRSANEEIQSSNEELQSINEELETAKEELQSTNEELATVNEELEARNTQLARLNDDHSNFVNSLNIAFITVDNQLLIRNFTAKTKDLMNIIDSDLGRPITDIKLKIKIPDLEKLILQCIEKLTSTQLEFQDDQNHWYSIRIRPYHTIDNRIDGAVIAFLDINDIKVDLNSAISALDYAESIISAIHHPLLIMDKNLLVLSASDSYYDLFKVSAKDTIGNLLYHLGNGEWAIPKLREKLQKVINDGEPFDNFRVEHVFENIGKTCIHVFGRQIIRKKPNDCLALMQIEIVNDSEIKQ